MASSSSDLGLDSKLGAAFLGNTAAAVFYGITSVQTYIFFKSSEKDRRSFKALIFFLWILDTLHLALVTHALYFYMITNFSNTEAIVVPSWSILSQVYVTCISDLIVRGFDLGSFLAFQSISWMMYTALSSGVAADVVIAVSLVTVLLRSRTGFKRTDSLVNTLMLYTINTGLFTTFFMHGPLFHHRQFDVNDPKARDTDDDSPL
ncbi:hypothetical protein EYR36_001646 [Pleurotus pulmonarius]|nr:hypothetical protein EYR36_008411 [Pleurotus pulmonarius]KAF4579826.1 hypothetical protein EYR36_001646 [Pleurotus pulmonarius]